MARAGIEPSLHIDAEGGARVGAERAQVVLIEDGQNAVGRIGGQRAQKRPDALAKRGVVGIPQHHEARTAGTIVVSVPPAYLPCAVDLQEPLALERMVRLQLLTERQKPMIGHDDNVGAFR